NIARIYDYGKTPTNTLYLVMEWLEGCTLSTLIEQEPEIEIERAIKLIIQVCEGLICLHQRGQLYGALKPANIMVVYDEDGKECVKLLDCGFSRMKTTRLCSALPSLIAQRLLDTPHYLAAEICDGQEGDARSEVYALSAIFFEMLAGRPPFIG